MGFGHRPPHHAALRHGAAVWHAAFSPDGRRLHTASGDEVRTWDLSPDERSVEELTLLAQLQAGRSLDATGSFVPLDYDKFRSTWRALQAKSPAARPAEEKLAWHRHEAASAEAAGEWRAARLHLDFLIAAEPKRGALLFRRGLTRARLDEWEKAAGDFAAAAEGSEAPPEAWFYRALLCLELGDRQGYRRGCAEMLDRFGKTDSPGVGNTVAWACALGPDAVTDYARPVQLARSAVSKSPKNYAALNTLGTILYRAGEDDKAVEQLTEALKAHGKDGAPPDWLVLAMAHHRLGHAEEARKWWDRAAAEIENGDREDQLKWTARLERRLLYREAKERLGTADPPSHRATK